MRHLMSPLDFSTEELEELMDLADDIRLHPEKYAKSCEGKKLATCFYEPSTRTRLSFEAAMLNLGGSVLGFSSADSSSAAKGESVSDTIRVISGYADICAMRHPKEGAPLVASLHSEIPVINAGDGGHQHPTQTLTDLFTIRSLKGKIQDLTIGLCGRSEIRADRPLPDQRPGTLPQHPLRPDLPGGAADSRLYPGGRSGCQPRPLRGSGKTGGRHGGSGHPLHDPCPERTVL